MKIRVIYKILLMLLIFVAASCGSKKKLARTSEENKKERQERRTPVAMERNEDRSSERETERSTPRTYVDKVAEYIRLYSPIAKQEMELYRIPASITLAQGILESGAGEGDLTRRANNHFGIKCHGWEGESVFHDDDRRGECFRKYADPKYSFRDHSLFLTERKRYAGLFELDIDDYEGWAKGLRAAGYATDRKYPEKLINIIERYELYRYDDEVLGRVTPKRAYTSNTSEGEKYIVKQGDTLYSIAKRYNLSVEQLKQNNRLNGNTISIGQILYITP